MLFKTFDNVKFYNIFIKLQICFKYIKNMFYDIKKNFNNTLIKKFKFFIY